MVDRLLPDPPSSMTGCSNWDYAFALSKCDSNLFEYTGRDIGSARLLTVTGDNDKYTGPRNQVFAVPGVLFPLVSPFDARERTCDKTL